MQADEGRTVGIESEQVRQLVARARVAQQIADAYDQARVDDLVAAAVRPSPT